MDHITDESPNVRVTKVNLLCMHMNAKWEKIPEKMLKTYFRILVDDLSRDSESSEVRCAVARGIEVLLKNPLAAKTLQNILPKLSGLFHDNSENVRIAFCNVLLRVKTIPYIKYFDIVPLEELLARMEEDCHAVKMSISNLICNSFFPANENHTIWLSRCLKIMNPKTTGAARVFFSYAVNFIGCHSAVKFILFAIQTIHFSVKKTLTQVSNKADKLEKTAVFKNPKVVCSLLNCLVVMWLSLEEQCVNKPENKKYLKMLVKNVRNPLTDLCIHYKSTPVWDSIFYTSSFFSPIVVPSLGSLCFLRLKNLPPDAQMSEYFILLECLCYQQQEFQLLKLLKSWIEVGLGDSYSPPPVKKRKTLSKNGESVYFDVPKPYLANEMMNALFSHTGLQKVVLSHGDILKEMLYFVDDIKRKFEKNSAETMSEKDAVFLRLLLFNIIRMAVFLHGKRPKGDIKFVIDLVQWTEMKLFQNLNVIEEKRDVFTDMISDYCKNLCEVLTDITELGYCDPNSCVYLEFFEKLLRTGYREKFAVISAKFLYKCAACAQFLYIKENELIMIQNLSEHLCASFGCYNDNVFLNSLTPNVIKELQFILSNVMQIFHNYIDLFQHLSFKVFMSIIKFIIDGTLDEAKSYVTNLICEPFDKIAYPKSSAFFLSVVTLKPKLMISVMVHFAEFFKNQDKQNISVWISCWCLLNNLLRIKYLPTHTQKLNTKFSNFIKQMEENLLEIYPKQKDCEPTEKQFNGNISGTKKNPEVHVFHKHCHSELMRLELFSKLSAAKKNVQ